MKKLIIIIVIAFTACTNQVKTDHQDSGSVNKQEDTSAAVQLNDGHKWKTDEATRKNVAAMVKLVNDSSYADVIKRKELLGSMQSKIDTLIQECRMKGADHDALHLWLEKVMKRLKDLKEEDDQYIRTFTALKKDIESFYLFFE